MPRKVLRVIVEYRRDRFDWRAAERRLNGLSQFTTEIDGRIVHYVHVKGVDPESTPLVLTHGWPGSFVGDSAPPSMGPSQRFAERSSVARAPKCRRYVRPSTELLSRCLYISCN